MGIINLIGLALGFVGSVLLSAGLLKSKEAAVDEETPFWGENPFKVRDVLVSRNLALWGFLLFVAGFATTAMVEFASMANIKTVFGVAAGSLALTFLGWLVILLLMQRKSSSHIEYKNAHFRKALLSRLELQIKNLNKIMASPNPGNYDFNSVKYGNLEILIGLKPDVDKVTSEKLQTCLHNINNSTEFQGIKAAMENCSAEIENV